MSTQQTTLTTYATAFLASISLFGLVDAGQVAEGVATAITRPYLLPVLGIATATFLGLTVMVLSRGWLARPQVWNSDRAESRLLHIGLAAVCYFGVLALLSYLLALLAPVWAGGLALMLTRYWPWLLALPCLVIGAASRRNKSGWLAGGAVFVTMGLFTS